MRLIKDPVLPPIPERLPVPPPFPEGTTLADMLEDTPPHPLRGSWWAEWEWRNQYNANVDALEERLTRCSLDILEFAKEYFPEVFRAEFANFHRELTDLVFDLPEEQWYYEDSISGAQLEKQGIVVAAPRGHAKSTLITFLLPIYCAVFRVKRFVVIFSNNIEGVTQFCTQIKREIEENEKLRADFGEMSGKTHGRQWGAYNFVMVHTEVDADGVRSPVWETMIAGRSIGTNVRGMRFGPYRPDFIICDDIEKDENVQTLDQRNKLQGLLTQRILPMLDPQNGTFMFCGTLIHFDSLLARLLSPQAEQGWVRRIWKCIKDNGARDILDPRAEALWPEWWSIPKLRAKRLAPPMTLHEWNTEWMNDPRDPENREYKPEWVQWYSRSSNLRYNSKEEQYEWNKPGDTNPLTGEPRWQRLHIYQAVDPSVGQSAQNDYFAMLTGGLSAETHDVVLINLVHDHLNFAEQVNTIENQFMQFPMTIGCAIETVQYQDVLRQTIVSRQARRYKVRKVPVKGVKQQRNKDGKTGRLRRRAWDMQTGTVWFPYLREGDRGYQDAPSSEETDTGHRVRVHPIIYPLYAEMMEFPKSRNDDTLDAFDMLLSVIGRRRVFGDYAEAEREENRMGNSPLGRIPRSRVPMEPMVNPSGGATVTAKQRVGSRRRSGRGVPV